MGDCMVARAAEVASANHLREVLRSESRISSYGLLIIVFGGGVVESYNQTLTPAISMEPREGSFPIGFTPAATSGIPPCRAVLLGPAGISGPPSVPT